MYNKYSTATKPTEIMYIKAGLETKINTIENTDAIISTPITFLKANRIKYCQALISNTQLRNSDID